LEPIEGPSIALYGELLQHEVASFMQFVAPGSTVLEANAGVGVQALGLSVQVGPTGHVLLYEDDSRRYQLLIQNLAANGVPNATVMRGSLTGKGDPKLPVDRIDDLYLERLDWIKLTGTAAVASVLEGAAETLWRLRPRVFARAQTEQSLRDLAACLRSYGYRCWSFTSPIYNDDNFNRRRDNLFGSEVSVAIVAFPEEIDVRAGLERAIEIVPEGPEVAFGR
jgi:precorrin-6B methylase 2